MNAKSITFANYHIIQHSVYGTYNMKEDRITNCWRVSMRYPLPMFDFDRNCSNLKTQDSKFEHQIALLGEGEGML